MGIQGLLPFLEKATRKCHISELRGSTVAVDSYCWLHKGAFGCAEKLIKGEDTDSYVTYCLKYVNLLKNYGIRVVMVFDGKFLKAKKNTEEKRRNMRQKARKQAIDLLHTGNIQEARKYMGSAINITHNMALNLIKACRKLGVDCIVAPYEADAQLAYLNVNKFVDFIITEDSDLLLFGCNKILFKMDLNGIGSLVESDKIFRCMNLRPDVYTFDKFRYMCILSGCDYLESLPGVGLKKALKFVSLTANTDIYNVLSKLPSYINRKNLTVTTEYKDAFMIADATFKHQLVFDFINRKLVSLQDPNILGTTKEYCVNAGEFFDNKTAFQLALGNLDPFTLEKLDDWLPNEVNYNSIWSKHYKKTGIKEVNHFKCKEETVKVARDTENEKIEEERHRTNYTMEIEKELDIYKTESMKCDTLIVSSLKKDETSVATRKTSIFANKQKISKFDLTNIDNVSNPTCSKYFSSNQSKLAKLESTEDNETVLMSITETSSEEDSRNALCNEDDASNPIRKRKLCKRSPETKELYINKCVEDAPINRERVDYFEEFKVKKEVSPISKPSTDDRNRDSSDYFEEFRVEKKLPPTLSNCMSRRYVHNKVADAHIVSNPDISKCVKVAANDEDRVRVDNCEEFEEERKLSPILSIRRRRRYEHHMVQSVNTVSNPGTSKCVEVAAKDEDKVPVDICEELEEERKLSPILSIRRRRRYEQHNVPGVDIVSKQITGDYLSSNHSKLNKIISYSDNAERVLMPLVQKSSTELSPEDNLGKEDNKSKKYKCEESSMYDAKTVNTSTVDDDNVMQLSQKENITTSSVNGNDKSMITTKLVSKGKKNVVVRVKSKVRLEKNQPTLLSMFKKY